jgi:hypothetical protein
MEIGRELKEVQSTVRGHSDEKQNDGSYRGAVIRNGGYAWRAGWKEVETECTVNPSEDGVGEAGDTIGGMCRPRC